MSGEPDGLQNLPRTEEESARWLPAAGITAGFLLSIAGLAIGVIGGPLAMKRAFETLGRTGAADPSALAAIIGHALRITTAGIVLVLAGGVLLVVSFAAQRRQERE